MIIKRVFDENTITKIVMSMFDDVVEDGTSKDCFCLDVNSDCWLSCGDYKALFHIKAFNRTTLDIHCYIPKENRNKSKEYGLMAIDWINNNAPKMYKKIITQSPSIYRHIRIYLKSVGFNIEGCYKKSFLKNGKVYDLNLFGMDREFK